MDIPNYQAVLNGADSTLILRLTMEITRLAAQWGYDGDPMAERVPSGKTLGDLHAAHNLFQALPAELRNKDRDLAFRMCQKAVFGSTRPTDRSLPPQESSKPTADAKLARERNRRQAWRASA